MDRFKLFPRFALFWPLAAVVITIVGCAKDQPLGPDIGTLFGELVFTDDFGHNMPNGVHFDQVDGVLFSAEFNLPVAYTLSLEGQLSGATYTQQGQGDDALSVLWRGDCDDVFFGQNEWVYCLLEFPNHPNQSRLDSVFVWEQPDLSSRGYLLASFEEDAATYSLSSGEFTQSLEVVVEALDAAEGEAYMRGTGAGAASWFGALRMSLSPGNLLGFTRDDTYLNLHLRSSLEGSATVIKVFEDSDGDGTVASGMDEVYTTKLAVNADGDWHRRSVLWSDLELDLSGGNVMLDGQLNVEKVIRIDCTVSQMGTAQGDFGMDLDYVILTQSGPF